LLYRIRSKFPGGLQVKPAPDFLAGCKSPTRQSLRQAAARKALPDLRTKEPPPVTPAKNITF
jgi:hypothetical protein